MSTVATAEDFADCLLQQVLQILVSCVPFYQFLDHIGRRVAHSFQSDLPLIDAM